MQKVIYALAVAGGVVAGLGGLLLGLGLGFMAATGGGRGSPVLQQATVALAAPVIGLGCGALLVWAGLGALAGAADRPLRLPGWGWWLLGLLVVVAAGQAAFSLPAALRWQLPAFHLLAGALGAFLFLALVVGAARARGATVSARAALGSLAWGALGGGSIAVVAELVLLILAVLLAAVWLSATRPDILRQLQDWAMRQAQNPGGLPNLNGLLPVATSPLIILAALAGVGLFVPLIEESAKSLAVPIVALTGRRLTRLDGFLLGVASGAGFTLLEGILNGSLALTDPQSWWFAMLLRGGTAALHCLATGLTGLAWQSVLVERRGWRAAGLAASAVAVHGIWNLTATFSALLGFAGDGSPSLLALTTVGRIATAVAMACLWLAVVVALPLLAGRLAGQSPAPNPPPEDVET